MLKKVVYFVPKIMFMSHMVMDDYFQACLIKPNGVTDAPPSRRKNK